MCAGKGHLLRVGPFIIARRYSYKAILQAVVLASAGLLLAATIPLAHVALTDWVTVAIAAVSLVLLLTTELDTLWIILGAAVISLSASSLGIVAMLG